MAKEIFSFYRSKSTIFFKKFVFKTCYNNFRANIKGVFRTKISGLYSKKAAWQTWKAWLLGLQEAAKAEKGDVIIDVDKGLEVAGWFRSETWTCMKLLREPGSAHASGAYLYTTENYHPLRNGTLHHAAIRYIAGATGSMILTLRLAQKLI